VAGKDPRYGVTTQRRHCDSEKYIFQAPASPAPSGNPEASGVLNMLLDGLRNFQHGRCPFPPDLVANCLNPCDLFPPRPMQQRLEFARRNAVPHRAVMVGDANSLDQLPRKPRRAFKV
jgi:hypothetical protein